MLIDDLDQIAHIFFVDNRRIDIGGGLKYSKQTAFRFGMTDNLFLIQKTWKQAISGTPRVSLFRKPNIIAMQFITIAIFHLTDVILVENLLKE